MTVAVFEINLLKDRMVSAPVRRALFWGIAVYLVVCIVALAWLANSTTLRLLQASRLRKSVDAAEEQFRRNNHRTQDVLEFAEQAKSRLEMDARSLENIDRLIRNRISLVNILSALTAPLPSGVELMKLRLDSRDSLLTFSVVIPEGRTERQISGARLTSVWNADETLQARLGRIRAVSTRRERVDGRAVVVMQFSALVKGSK